MRFKEIKRNYELLSFLQICFDCCEEILVTFNHLSYKYFPINFTLFVDHLKLLPAFSTELNEILL